MYFHLLSTTFLNNIFTMSEFPSNYFSSLPYNPCLNQPNPLQSFAAFCKTPDNLKFTNFGLEKSSVNSQPAFLKVEDNQKNAKFLIPQSDIQRQSHLVKQQAKKNTPYHKRGRYRRIRNKQTKVRVKYFDPSNAPIITSPLYFLIDKTEPIYLGEGEEEERLRMARKGFELKERDTSPFIIFKHRRIPKKYRKYINPSHEDNQNVQNQSSEL